MTRKTAVLAIAALMVVGSSAALAVGAGPAATDEGPLAQETETTTAAGQLGAGVQVTFLNQSAGVTFTDTEPNKTTVTIERVVVPEGGFLVVHEAQNVTGEYATEGQVEVGGVVGNSTYLEPGAHSNVVVELNESIDSTQTLVAMPHRDTNDNRQYEFPEADAPYTMDGSPVIDNALVIVEYDVIDATFGDEENGTTTEA